MVYCSRAVASRQNSLRHLSLRYSVLECNYYVYTQCVCVCACVYVLVLVHVCVQFARKNSLGCLQAKSNYNALGASWEASVCNSGMHITCAPVK